MNFTFRIYRNKEEYTLYHTTSLVDTKNLTYRYSRTGFDFYTFSINSESRKNIYNDMINCCHITNFILEDFISNLIRINQNIKLVNPNTFSLKFKNHFEMFYDNSSKPNLYIIDDKLTYTLFNWSRSEDSILKNLVGKTVIFCYNGGSNKGKPRLVKLESANKKLISGLDLTKNEYRQYLINKIKSGISGIEEVQL